MRVPASIALAFLLAACGGGGDAAPPPPAGPAPAPAPAVVLGTCNLPDFSAALLQRVNALRASGATCGSTPYARTGALRWNSPLTQSADGHARDMATRNYMSHTSADGRTLADRVDAAGYAWTRIGENIAGGQASVDEVMDTWIASPGHCANLMRPDYADIGVACVPRSGSATYSHYWVMNLGAPR